jgi:hypothetical protein
MAWNAAMVTTFGVPVPGREAQSLQVFADAQTFFGKLAADGKCSEPEAFLFADGGGILLVRGETLDVLYEIAEMDEFRRYTATALYTTEDFDLRFASTGEQLGEFLSIYAAVGTELGYI